MTTPISLAKQDVRVEIHEDEMRRLYGVAALLLRGMGRGIVRDAQRDAPVSNTGSHGRPPGYLRANIRMREGVQSEGPYVLITTDARTPDGFRYGAYWQRRRPYLRARF